MKMLAIINAELIMKDHFIPEAVLLIEDGKIVGYGEMRNTPIPEGCEVIDAEGAYVDADGVRWDVRWGNTVLECRLANEELGYEAWPSVEAALEEWGLTEWRPEGMEE